MTAQEWDDIQYKLFNTKVPAQPSMATGSKPHVQSSTERLKAYERFLEDRTRKGSSHGYTTRYKKY